MTALTRRALLGGGVAIGGALAVGGGLAGLVARTGTAAFMLDARLPRALHLGDLIQKAGHDVLMCDKDVSEMALHWQRRWETAPSALIGGSLASTAFVIEQIAVRSGMRFVRGEKAGKMAACAAGTSFSEAMADLHATSTRWKGSAVWWCASPAKKCEYIQV